MSSGRPRLSEVAKYLVTPAGVTATGWPAVAATCSRRMGITFDEWQHGAGRLALAKRADGTLAATVGGIGMSAMRQIGKTYFWAGTLFGLSVNMPGLLSIWTAHHAKTHAETFLAMQAFASRVQVAPFVKRVRTGNGKEAVEFINGSRILFGAREHGFGRGIPGVSALICDEGQILSERAAQDMLATLNTGRLGLFALIGTPPKPGDNAEIWLRTRGEALSGESTEVAWIEFGAPDDADLDDETHYAANPSYPTRTPASAFRRLRAKLDDDGYRREALGLYDAASRDVFDLAAWIGLTDMAAPAPSRVAVAAAVTPDRRYISVGTAGELDDGRRLVMFDRVAGALPADYGRDVSGAADAAARIAELVATRDVPDVSLAGAAAKLLAPELTRLGIEYTTLGAAEMAPACSTFQESVAAGTVTHVGQSELDAAVANARVRLVGEAQQFDRRDCRIDDSPLIAVAAALYRLAMQESPVPLIY